jgi:mannose-6-phosphate isomerase-like protein (cupin superfamily)
VDLLQARRGQNQANQENHSSESVGAEQESLLPASISRENAPHYVWGDNCDGWHLLQESNLSVIEERMPPGASEVRHFHTNAQQFFFILSGQAEMETKSERILLLAGQGVAIPPRTLHQFRNHSEEPVRFLVISQLSSYGDRVTE